MVCPIKISICYSLTVLILFQCLMLSSGFFYYLHELAHILQKIVLLLFYINKNTNRHFIISKVILVHKWALCVIVISSDLTRLHVCILRMYHCNIGKNKSLQCIEQDILQYLGN